MKCSKISLKGNKSRQKGNSRLFDTRQGLFKYRCPVDHSVLSFTKKCHTESTPPCHYNVCTRAGVCSLEWPLPSQVFTACLSPLVNRCSHTCPIIQLCMNVSQVKESAILPPWNFPCTPRKGQNFLPVYVWQRWCTMLSSLEKANFLS